MKIKRIFLLGRPMTDQKTPLIEHESRRHNDILMGDFDDVYMSVSQKTFSGLRFVKTYCRHVDFVTMMDDDAIVFPWNYYPLLPMINNSVNG